MGRLTRQFYERRRFARLDEWMRSNLQADLSVPALADRALMSKRSLARRYVEVTGSTIAQAVERLRIDAAMALLEAVTDQPPGIGRIAHTCGYDCERTFVRAFRRRYGTSPAAWLEQRLGRRIMTEEEADELLTTIDKRLVCLQTHLDRQVGYMLYELQTQLGRIERLVGGNPPPIQPPGEDTPPVEPPPASE